MSGELYKTDLERRLYDTEGDRPTAARRRKRLGWFASILGLVGGFGLAYWAVRRRRGNSRGIGAGRPGDPSSDMGPDDDIAA